MNRRPNKNHPRYIDLDGLRFGKLTILKSDLPNRRVLAKCDCGREFKPIKSSVISGKTTSCNKGMCHSRTENLEGQRFGKLTATKLVKSKSEHKYGTLWECICDCGTYTKVVAHSLKTGYTKSCGCSTGYFYSKKATKANMKPVIKNIIQGYHAHAKKLKLPIDLTDEIFLKLMVAPCHYCGKRFSNKRTKKTSTYLGVFKYNGVDRKNPNLGYEYDNCVTSCKDCNYAKRKLSYDEFIALAKRIAALHK